MVDPNTIAVVGSSPSAVFLAGLLAADQSRKVALVRDPEGVGHLAHGLDITFTPMIRPDNWVLLERLVPETLRLLGRMGDPVWERLDLVVSAHGSPAQAALGHLHQMTLGFGLPVEPFTAAGGRAIRVRDRHRLLHEAFWGQAEPWLARSGVLAVRPADFTGPDPDGTSLVHGDRFAITVLADDGAVARYGPVGELERGGRFLDQTSILCEPAAPLPARLGLDLDTGALVHQRATGAIQVFGSVDAAPLPASLSPILGGLPLRLSGRARYRRFLAHDNGPVVGPTRRSRAVLLAGLGPAGLMFTPAIARWIMGTASPEEAAWCHARRPTRGVRGTMAAEPALADL